MQRLADDLRQQRNAKIDAGSYSSGLLKTKVKRLEEALQERNEDIRMSEQDQNKLIPLRSLLDQKIAKNTALEAGNTRKFGTLRKGTSRDEKGIV